MKKFARIIELPKGQVLITTSYNHEDDEYKVNFRTDIYGVELNQTLGFKDEDKAIELLNSYPDKDAKKFYNIMKKLVE